MTIIEKRRRRRARQRIELHAGWKKR